MAGGGKGTDGWEVDEPVFRDGIRLLIAKGLRDLYIFGTAGEGYAVSERQFDQVLRIFVDEMRAHDLLPMVGVITMSLSTVIERIERGLDQGVRLFQISLPSWGPLNPRETEVFFAETCGRFPEARFLHYNLPRTGRLISPGEYACLAKLHPNLVATKNAGADIRTVTGLLTEAGALRHFVTEPGHAYGSLLGETGFLISVSSMNPALARAYFEAGLRRDGETLGRYARELQTITTRLLQLAGPNVQMDGAYDKVFSKMLDPRFSLRLLPPYNSYPEDTFNAFRAFLTESFPHWLPDGESGKVASA